MADLGTKGTLVLSGELGSPGWPDDRLDPSLSPGEIGLLVLSGELGFRVPPYNTTGAASGQPVIGASIQIA